MSSATFEANPNSENEPWIERPALQGVKFRIWHLMFFCLCAFGLLIVLICCCVKIRIPRTKQEIEADYKRKRIAGKFRKRLKIINNQDMEAVDLRKALEIIIEADYRNETQKTEKSATVLQISKNEDIEKLLEEKRSFGISTVKSQMGKIARNKKY